MVLSGLMVLTVLLAGSSRGLDAATGHVLMGAVSSEETQYSHSHLLNYVRRTVKSQAVPTRTRASWERDESLEYPTLMKL